MSDRKSYYDLVIYIIGPDNEFYYQPILDFLVKKNDNVVVIGDGKKELINNENKGELTDVLNYIKMFFLSSSNNVLVYMHAHGVIQDGEYYLQLGGLIKTESFFQNFAQQINQPIDLLFFPCHGKAALPYINYLFNYSKVVIFSREAGFTHPFNIFKSFEAILDLDFFSLEVFYDVYLGHLSNIENPIFITVPNVTIDPLGIVDIFLGKQMPQYLRDFTKNHFAVNVCKNSSDCFVRMDQVIDKIEVSSSAHDFLNYDHKYIDLLQMIDVWKDQMIENNSLALCSSKLISTANQIDEYLFKHAMPLETDLSYEFWYTKSLAKRDITGLLDIDIFNRLVGSYFNKNDKFPEPGFLEIGSLFGIVKDFYLYFTESH